MKQIKFPDGTIKSIYQNGEEESIFTDGTIQKIDKQGNKTIEYINGDRDVFLPDGTRATQ